VNGVSQIDRFVHIELAVARTRGRSVERGIEYKVAVAQIDVPLDVQDSGRAGIARTQGASFIPAD
jgi:hypothetical protein